MDLLGARILQELASATSVHVLNSRASGQLVQAQLHKSPLPRNCTTSSILLKLLLPFQNVTFKRNTKEITELWKALNCMFGIPVQIKKGIDFILASTAVALAFFS
ncbi:unnamed protein product [Urochloa humidicola]